MQLQLSTLPGLHIASGVLDEFLLIGRNFVKNMNRVGRPNRDARSAIDAPIGIDREPGAAPKFSSSVLGYMQPVTDTSTQGSSLVRAPRMTQAMIAISDLKSTVAAAPLAAWRNPPPWTLSEFFEPYGGDYTAHPL